MTVSPRKSPDGSHILRFDLEGEIRFGPTYYRAEVNRSVIPAKIFGDIALWSPDSRFLVLQEWLTTDYTSGPQTALHVIDFVHSRSVRASWADKGFITPIRFDGETLVYKKQYFGIGKIAEFEIDLGTLDRWESFLPTKTEPVMDVNRPSAPQPHTSSPQ